MTRTPNTLARALAHRDRPDSPLASTSLSIAMIDGRGRATSGLVSASAIEALAGVSADDVDPRGTWGGRRVSPGRHDVTAAFCGDPEPGRSALDQRGRG